MKALPETEERIMLKTIPPGHDLDGFLFSDLPHALTWLSQGIIQNHQEDFAVVLVTVTYGKRKCPSCGHRTKSIRPRQHFSVAEFLAIHGVALGAEEVTHAR